MQFKLEIEDDVLNRAKEKLSPSQIATALRMAINEGVTKGRTQVRRGVQETYNFKASTINKALQITKATNAKLTGTIGASNKPVSIKETDPKFSARTIGRNISYKNGKVKKGKAIRRSVSQITVEVLKGQSLVIETAFVPGVARNATTNQQFATSAVFARGKRGKPGFEFGKKRYPIDVISTVSPGTAANNERSAKIYSKSVTEYANQRFVYHIERLIKAAEQ
jgi:hypothetical protein